MAKVPKDSVAQTIHRTAGATDVKFFPQKKPTRERASHLIQAQMMIFRPDLVSKLPVTKQSQSELQCPVTGSHNLGRSTNGARQICSCAEMRNFFNCLNLWIPLKSRQSGRHTGCRPHISSPQQ